MFHRLVGLETEYALRVHPRQPGEPRLSNVILFEGLLAQVQAKVPTARALVRENYWFLANGGALYLDRNPFLRFLAEAGVVEGATPECRGPRQLLRFQRAQDLLFARAALASGDGTLSLLKHNRDGRANSFGSHENYEIVLATGALLWLWRLGVALLTPVVILLAIATELTIYLVLGPFWLVFVYVAAWRESFGGSGEHRISRLREGALDWLFFLAFMPLALLWWMILRPLAFRRQRRQLLAFLVSRPIIAGTGTVHEDGRFSLSPRALAINAVDSAMSRCFRPFFYSAHFFKAMLLLVLGDGASYRQLFHRRQRFQVTFGDSNMTQTAEYLKIGTTLLVLDAIEAGALADAPVPRRPVRALRILCADPDLKARVRLTDGRSWTALAIQRYYLDACRRFVDSSPQPHPEAVEVLGLWAESLTALEDDPDLLIGKLDWVTKRYLLKALGPEAPLAQKRKLDLRYHELSRDGYYLQLEAAGVAPTVLDPEHVLQAMDVPPEGTPATVRGQLIHTYGTKAAWVRASWHNVLIKDGPRTRVVKL
jgi:proteasome accessory factor A